MRLPLACAMATSTPGDSWVNSERNAGVEILMNYPRQEHLSD